MLRHTDGGRAAATGVFVVALLVYVRTLLPGVGSFDIADAQVAAARLGVMHPTGYPLWTMIGFLWTRLPVREPAYLMNLLSAIFVSSAAGTAVLVARRLGSRPVIAAFAGVAFAFAGETWSNATRAEVHSLHVLLVSLLLLTWVVAEQTASRVAAAVMLAIVGIGLAHHRLMIVTGAPIGLLYVARNWRLFRSVRFAVPAVAAFALPLITYAYIPERRAHGAVVNADMSKGALAVIRGDVFAKNENAFSQSSPGRWIRTLPSYASMASHWFGWAVLATALVGAAVLLKKRPWIIIGLVWVVAGPTYALANRVDKDYRYLLDPLLALAILGAIGAEFLVARASRQARRWIPVTTSAWRGLALAWLVLIPLGQLTWAAGWGFSSHNRSADFRDERSGESILGSVKDNAVVWSYWDLRTTLEYLHLVRGQRPDVLVLDHRAYASYGCSACELKGDPIVAAKAAVDPRLAGRPFYYLTIVRRHVDYLKARFRLRPIVQVDAPFGFDRRFPATLYLVQPRAG